MGVVKGDRIGESQRINRCSIEAQEFYALLLSKAPDDFGRFRMSAMSVANALYPRREPTRALFRRVERLLNELAGGDEPLLYVWETDGVKFAQFYKFQPRGNRLHRTPEPPAGPASAASSHTHTAACASSARNQAAAWGILDEAERLGLLTKKLGSRKRAERKPKSSPPFAPSAPVNGPGANAPVAADGAEPPAAATPAQARDKALAVLGPPQKRETWLTAPGDLWRARWGDESEPPWGEMAREFARPRKAFEARGELDELWARWQRFLAAADRAEWARPARFVQGLGQWAADGRPPPRAGPKPGVGDVALDNARKAIEAHRARRDG